MLLQTNSYVVPKDRRAEHARLLRRFRQTLARLGCDLFEVYEQVGHNWSSEQSSGRFVQIMKFRDRRHQLAVQAAERNDPTAQHCIAEFCELINFPYQQQHGLFAVGFYTSIMPAAPARRDERESPEEPSEEQIATAQAAVAASVVAAEVPPPDQQTYVSDGAQTIEAEQSGTMTESAADPDTRSVPVIQPPNASEPATASADEPAETAAHDEPFAELHQTEAQARTTAELDAFHAELDSATEEFDPAPAGQAPADASVEPQHETGSNGKFASGAEDHAAEGEPVGEHLLQDSRALDALLAEHFGPAPDEARGPENGQPTGHVASGSGIGQVLDAGLLDADDLDVPLPAELIDEPSELHAHAPDSPDRGHGGHGEDDPA